MSNVIDFPLSETCCYTTGDGVVGVMNKSNEAEMVSHNGFHTIMCGDVSIDFKSRRELAEWLWMCAFMVDSEARWQAKEYVGIDYET